MKKFFSLIALAGVIAACTPEQIQTAFKLAGAKGTIEVEVVKLSGDPIEGQFSIAGFESLPGSSIAYSGNKATITFQAGESTPIAQQQLTLTATGEQILKPVSTTVTVPDLLAGQTAMLSCKIRAGESLEGWYFYEDPVEGDAIVKSGYLQNANYEKYSATHYDIPFWYVNNSEYILDGVAEIPYKIGNSAAYDIVKTDYAGFEEIYIESLFGLSEKLTVSEWLDYYLESYGEADIEEDVFEAPFQVSAWAMWNVYVDQATIPYDVKLYAVKLDEQGKETDEKVVLASFKLDFYDNYAGMIELAYPDAAGHYVQGHGHDSHGSAANAGGGISFNE